ncbi:MAG: hypothetical protein Q8Q36_02900 [bacterium]|nr:hypothetical protein [bacterium]
MKTTSIIWNVRAALMAAAASLALFTLFAPPTAEAAATDVRMTEAWQSAFGVELGMPNLEHTYHARFTNTGVTPERVMLDLELYSPLGRTNQRFEERTIAPGETVELTLVKQFQPDTVPGTWWFKTGIFNPGWAGLIRWHDEAAKTTVSGGTAGQVNGTIRLESATLDRTTMVRGLEAVHGTAVFVNESPWEMPVIVDFEVYRDGEKVYQLFWGDRIPAEGTRTRQATLGGGHLPPGVYTWKIGIFRFDWSGPLHWFDQAGTFAVVSG